MGKETKRQRQIAEITRRNISEVFQQEGSYIYGSEVLVTVTGVKMSPDMGIAKVYLSIYNTENKQAVLLHIDEEMQRIRSAFYERVRRHMRRMPDLQFYIDETLDEMYRIKNLFDRLHKENQMGDDENPEVSSNPAQ